MANDPRFGIKHTKFDGKIIMIGFGSIGQGVLPLILRHIDCKPEQIIIITGDDRGADIAKEYGVEFHVNPVTRENYQALLGGHLNKGDFLLNLSVDVSCVALMELAHEKGALYLDTVVEPWPGGYTDPNVPMQDRTNYYMRETMLALQRRLPADGPTAVVTHGANPGLVQHFVKRALLNIAKDTGHDVETPTDKKGWSELARDLGIKVIHIAERDNQIASKPKEVGEFVNTWSVEGFYSEGIQPSEMGWGSHEKELPHDGARHEKGSKAAIYLKKPGAQTRVRTWTPAEGPFHGFAVTHNESISIADYFTVGEGDHPEYRPTVHYAYHPCDAAIMSMHELGGKNLELQKKHRILMDEIITGIDELGVLLGGHKKNAYWYGSQLSIEHTREIIPHNNATGLQVTVAVLAGMIWGMENPNRGVIEPESLDHERILEICQPYLEPVVGKYTDWNPLTGRNEFFEEEKDDSDPWQFKNVRVVQ